MRIDYFENPKSGLQAYMYVDDRDDYNAAVYLEEHLEELKAEEESATFSKLAESTVNGIKAAYSEYTEKTDLGSDKYIVATYEVGEKGYELFIMSGDKKFEDNKAAMISMMNSFCVL